MLDWELADAGDSLERLRASAPFARVIALSSYPESRSPALLAGAAAFVSKGDAAERVLAVMHSLAASRNH